MCNTYYRFLDASKCLDDENFSDSSRWLTITKYICKQFYNCSNLVMTTMMMIKFQSVVRMEMKLWMYC